MDIENYLVHHRAKIEAHLESLNQSTDAPYHILIESSRYSLLNSGKRLRPLLTLATTEMFGGDLDKALTPACALEMIHTYSLIHDDLPCMDNDDFRRGKPTLHRVVSEGQAILTGDHLLTYAFELLASPSELTSDQKVSLIYLLAKNSGADGMIGGQVMDIASVNQEVDLDELQLIHQYKTGALIKTAILFGGIIAEASVQDMQSLLKFGEQLGLAFQIMDDILDVTDSEEKHGRKVASDVINGKTTYVTLLGIDKAKEACKMHFNQAIEALSDLSYNPRLLIALANHFFKI